MSGHKTKSQYHVYIHPGRVNNLQIGNNKTMYINSRGECSTSPPQPSETFAERSQRWEEDSRKRREEATKKRMEEKQKRREELMREDRGFEYFDMPIDWMTNERRGTENVDTGRDSVDTDRDTAYTDRGNVDADQETVVDTDAKKRREERQKIRDLDMSRIDYLRMRDERKRMKNVDIGRDPVDTDRDTTYTDRDTVDADQETVVDTEAKKRREERQKNRDEVKRGSHKLRDLDMARIDWLRMMDERRGMSHVDTDRDPGDKVWKPVETDRVTVDTDAKKRMEGRQKMRDEVKRGSHPLRDMSKFDYMYLRMMDERMRMKNDDPVNIDGRPVEPDQGADAKRRMEERQKRREEAMRGIYSFKDLDYLMINERRRRGRRMKIHTDSHEEDMRNTNMEDDIERDIGSIGEKGTKEEGENMDTEMENVDIDRDTVSSKGVCPVKTDRDTVDTDREEVDTDRDSVDTGRDTDRDSVDTGRDTMDTDRDTVDTDRDSVDTGRDTVDTDLDSVDTDRDNVTIKETQEDKHRTLGSVVSDVEHDDEVNREDAKEKNINTDGKYNGVNEDDFRYDRGNEDGYKYDRGNEHVDAFKMTNNCYDDNDFMHTHFTSIHNFGRCTNIQIGNQNKMIFSSTSDTPTFGFGQKNRNAWKRMGEFTKAKQDMAKLKREEAMKKRHECEKIKLQIFEDAFKSGDPKGVYGNRWGAGTSMKEQNQNMECEDDDDADYEKADTDHKDDDRDGYFMKKGASDKLNLVLLSKKIWIGGEGCHVNLERTVSIQELEDVLNLKSFGVQVDHIDRDRLGPIHRFEMDSNKPISYYSVKDGDQVILL